MGHRAMTSNHNLQSPIANTPSLPLLNLEKIGGWVGGWVGSRLSAAGLTALSLILATSLPLFAAACIAGRFLGYPWQTLGLETRALPGQIAVASTGLGLGTLQYLILRPPPLAPAQTWAQIWPPALILLVSTGLLEELIFRGLLLRTATQALGAWGLAYSALLFATMQLGYRCPAHAAFAFAMGAFFACVVQRTRSLSGVTLAHGLANTLTFLVMPSVFAP
jgi:uncharacterized protein